MAAIYARAYSNNLWPRCYSSVTTDAATNCLSESAGAVKGYTVINVFPDINPRILSSTNLHAGFLGQPMEIFNVHTTNGLVVASGTLFGPASGLTIPNYNQLCIGPLQTANFTYGPQGWVYTGNAILSSPVSYLAGTAGSPAQINVPNANITVVTAVSSFVKVPPALGNGARVSIYNATSNNAAVFPALGQNIGSSAANVSSGILASTTITLLDVAISTWAIL